ncbi:MAG TPA: hypothetical protein VMF07_18730 [Solirubrobacteraceae bacterium]|nr:hypothetical protein [Solirubrobacteraceae bacterium]
MRRLGWVAASVAVTCAVAACFELEERGEHHRALTEERLLEVARGQF